MPVGDLLAAGEAALEAGRWADARTAFEAALREQETAEALFGVGQAVWWLGETHLSVTYHERAYVTFRRSGEVDRAAWTAMWLCLAYQADFGNSAAANGWMARAERLLLDIGPGPLQGWLWLIRAYGASDRTRSLQFSEQALQSAQTSGDLDLELCALAAKGAALVEMSQIEEGLHLVDEAMAGALGGERSRFDTVVFTSCSMLAVCEVVADLERATQWCRIIDVFIRTYGCPFLHAYCRNAYGSILVATGRWADAERELLAAIQMTKDAFPAMQAQAFARLADLRLRQGRLEEAEELLTDTGDEIGSAPTVAAIRLVRGEPAVAVALIERWLNLTGEDYVEAPLALEVLVEAHLARGDVTAAAATAERLRELAYRHDKDHVAARAAFAAARVSIAKGDHGAAIEKLDEALKRFLRGDLPFEIARVRLELAQGWAEVQPAVAIAEAQRALAIFEQLGATARADAAAALLRSLGAPARTGPKHVGVLTQREQEVLHLVGLGLSNPEIAERLVISRKTASHHVSRVLAKLGLRNRAEAAAYVTRTLGSSLPVPISRLS